MIDVPKHVGGFDLVLNVFGRWPSFHDGHLEDVRFDESGSGSVTFKIHAFEMTNETDAHGYIRLTKHHDVLFRFDDVDEFLLQERDDILSSLDISSDRDSDGRFIVTIVSVIGNEDEGYGGSFRARSGVVLAVVATAGK